MRDAPFLVHEPAALGKRAGETPLIVEIPHAGVLVPPEFMPELVASARSIGRDADLHVDDLYEEACLEGASMLVSRTSRYVVDLNRAEEDVDAQAAVSGQVPSSPRGVIWRLTTDGDRALTGPLRRDALELRLAGVYRPYHAALRALVQRKVATFGQAVILAAHSMPSVARALHGDVGTAGGRRPGVAGADERGGEVRRRGGRPREGAWVERGPRPAVQRRVHYAALRAPPRPGPRGAGRAGAPPLHERDDLPADPRGVRGRPRLVPELARKLGALALE